MADVNLSIFPKSGYPSMIKDGDPLFGILPPETCTEEASIAMEEGVWLGSGRGPSHLSSEDRDKRGEIPGGLVCSAYRFIRPWTSFGYERF
jgi:hypothetical protein